MFCRRLHGLLGDILRESFNIILVEVKLSRLS